MQGLQWSVLLSVAISWNAFASGQHARLEPQFDRFNESVQAVKVSEFFSLASVTEISPRSYRIQAPGARFIKVHFSQFVLPARMTVEVRNAEGTEVYRYAAGKRDHYTIDASEGDNGVTRFSAMSISGDEAIVRILGRMDRFDPAIHRLEIDSFSQGAAPDATKKKSDDGRSTTETTCGVSERLDAVCYQGSEPAIFDRSRPVVMVITSKGKECTAWRVGSSNRLFTAGHCVSSQEDLDGAEIWFNYQASSCGGVQTDNEVKVTGGELLANDHTLDYSLFTVNDFASVSQFGYLGLDVRNGSVGEGIFIPQHGLGQPKQLALESDMNPGGLCQIDDIDHEGYAPGSDIGYFCDTTTSSSGSPVISSITGKVIALHHLGGCFNSGTKISKIWPQVASHFNNIKPGADSPWDFDPGNQLPQADFDFSCDALNCEFNASPSNDPDGSIVAFSWSLSDGTSASGLKVAHEFTQSGDYEISLEVEDEEGATDQFVQTVSIAVPNQEPEARFSTSCIETGCNFNAGSSTDQDGSIVSWNWTLGDGGNASGQQIDYTYDDEGTYTVQLTVVDDMGASDINQHTLSINIPNRSPGAEFTVLCDELHCSFDARASTDSDGEIVDYRWNFGDGNSASGKQTSHRYANDGDYSITLIIQDDEGATDSMPRNLNVTSANEKPVAQFTYSCEDKACSFEAITGSNNTATLYQWNFGDGNTAEGAVAEHVFERSGSYTVQLKADDDGDASEMTARRIRINAQELILDVRRNRQMSKPLVILSWTGAESGTVNIYRDGSLVSSTVNNGKHIDLNPMSGAKPVRYTVCESDSPRCSGESVLSF